jgi:hypothetical protein
VSAESEILWAALCLCRRRLFARLRPIGGLRSTWWVRPGLGWVGLGCCWALVQGDDVAGVVDDLYDPN